MLKNSSVDNPFPKIFVIILNWNGKKDTLACLESVQHIDYPNYEIIIVDNGSVDDSVSVIKEKFPQLLLLETGQNLGFTGGNNVGIEYALAHNADYIFLLNNDTIVDPQVLSTLIEASHHHPDAGILGSKIYSYYNTEKIWFAGGEWLASQGRFIHQGMGKKDNGKDWNTLKEVQYICGCALLIKAEVIKKIGMLDERYFLMWEETDWCYQARKAGYTSLFVPDSKVWHKISASFGEGTTSPLYQYFWWRNRLLWIERNLPLSEALPIYGQVIRALGREIKNYLNPQSNEPNKQTIKAILQGVQDYFWRRFGDCPAWLRSTK